MTRDHRWCRDCMPLLLGGAAVGGGGACPRAEYEPQSRREIKTGSSNKYHHHARARARTGAVTSYLHLTQDWFRVQSQTLVPHTAPNIHAATRCEKRSPRASFVALSSDSRSFEATVRVQLRHGTQPRCRKHGSQATPPEHTHAPDPHMPQMF